jgi:WD40 repeat protein
LTLRYYWNVPRISPATLPLVLAACLCAGRALAQDKQLLAKLPGPSGTVVEFSRDDKFILAAGGDEARVWDAQTFKPLTGPLLHEEGRRLPIARLAPDGRRVLTATENKARVWDLPGGDHPRSLRHGGTVWWAEFSHDGSRIVTAGDDGLVRIWDAASGKPLRDLRHPAAVKFATFSPGGGKVLTIAVPNKPDQDWLAENKFFRSESVQLIRMWDARTGEILFRRADENIHLPERGYWFAPAAFSPDSKWAVSAANAWLAVVWDTRTGYALCSVDTRSEELGWNLGWPLAMTFSPDGSAFTACSDGGACVWKVGKGNGNDPPRMARIGAAGVQRVALSPDSRRLLLTTSSKDSGVWDLATERQVLALRPARSDPDPRAFHGGAGGAVLEIPAAAFSPDGKRVAAGFPSDGFTGVWAVPAEAK